jgi:hypothetical protein
MTWLLLAGLCLATPVPAAFEHAQAADVVTSFISGTSPTLVLGLDNNLEICLALREPATMEELRARGVPVLESQRVLLLAWRLIRRLDGGRYQTVLPIIAPPATDSLRTEGRSLAARLSQRCAPELKALLQQLKASHLEANRYGLVGSWVLDGMVWRKLEQRGILEHADASKIDSGSREWSGVAWIVHPQPSFKFGTNQRSFEGGRLWVSWTPEALPRLRMLDEPATRESLVVAIRFQRAPGGAAAKLLESAGLLRAGKVAIPLLTSGNPLWSAADSLADKVAGELGRAIDEGILARAGSALHGSAGVIIFYHEVFPQLMQAWSDRLPLPPVLAGDPRADLGPVVFATLGD